MGGRAGPYLAPFGKCTFAGKGLWLTQILKTDVGQLGINHQFLI